jgi:membrane protein HdeD
MLVEIISILAGLILLAGVLQRNVADNWLFSTILAFKGVIGLIAIVVGVLNFSNVIGIALIVGGFILSADVLSSIPEIGEELKRAGQALKSIGGLVSGPCGPGTVPLDLSRSAPSDPLGWIDPQRNRR